MAAHPPLPGFPKQLPSVYTSYIFTYRGLSLYSEAFFGVLQIVSPQWSLFWYTEFMDVEISLHDLRFQRPNVGFSTFTISSYIRLSNILNFNFKNCAIPIFKYEFLRANTNLSCMLSWRRQDRPYPTGCGGRCSWSRTCACWSHQWCSW